MVQELEVPLVQTGRGGSGLGSGYVIVGASDTSLCVRLRDLLASRSGAATGSCSAIGSSGGSVGCNGWNESIAKSSSSSSCCCLCFLASGSVGEDVVVGSGNAAGELDDAGSAGGWSGGWKCGIGCKGY